MGEALDEDYILLRGVVCNVEIQFTPGFHDNAVFHGKSSIRNHAIGNEETAILNQKFVYWGCLRNAQGSTASYDAG